MINHRMDRKPMKFHLPFYIVIVLFLALAFTGCTSGSNLPAVLEDVPDPTVEPEKTDPADDTEISLPAPSEEPDENLFTFLIPEGATLESRISPPKYYVRIPSPATEITGYLRGMKLKADQSEVLLYDGSVKQDQDSHAAVFELDTGNRDLQQCADSIIRIYAEYYWSLGAFDKIAFHLTNGFLMEYTKWREGNRIIVDGNDVRWSMTEGYDDSYDSFRKYLDMVFAYAGTLSLTQESERVTIEQLAPGDMLLQGGSPGHCILVVDVAQDSTGSRCFLLAQGYMPAQDFHVIKNPLRPEDPWYYEEEFIFPLETPAWTFDEGSLMRWTDFSSEETEISEVTLLAVGDNLIHIEVVLSGKQTDGSYNFDHLYANVKDEISKADIAIVNQETILGGDDFPYSGYPDFNSPYEIGDALVNAGFDVVLHATNHTMDMGLAAVQNTFSYWSGYPGVKVLGINETEAARKEIPVIEKNGIKIAMLNYTYSLNGYHLPEEMPYLVNLLDKEEMEKDILLAGELADFVIIFPHWGSEYVYEVSGMQEDLTDFFYELGVDLVIGTHPHVLEPVEWIGDPADHPMLVFYSLGNFMSYQKEAPRMLGGIVSVTIKKDSSGTYISDAGISPIVTHFENGPADYNYGIYHLTEYNSGLADVHGVSDIARQGEFTYEDTYSLAKDVLGNWFSE